MSLSQADANDQPDTKIDLPFLMEEDRPRQKHERKARRERLRRLLMESISPPKEEKGKKASPLDRLLRLAATIGDAGADTAAIDRQIGLYLERGIGRMPTWRRNADYASEEGSPYFGSAVEFLRRFPGGIAEWRKWHRKAGDSQERMARIAALMPDAQDGDSLEDFLQKAWDGRTVSAHHAPEGDSVAKLGDKEPKIWSDNPKWRSIGEFLEAHREHFGQDADDAALRAARDFVKYWKLTTRKPNGGK
jgi:hypothetical protein